MKGVNIEDEIGVIDVCGSFVVYNVWGINMVYFIDLKIGWELWKIIILYFKSKGFSEKVFVKEIKIIFFD